jgi:hypothetical protein
MADEEAASVLFVLGTGAGLVTLIGLHKALRQRAQVNAVKSAPEVNLNDPPETFLNKQCVLVPGLASSQPEDSKLHAAGR